MIICTSISTSYLPKALTLAKSIKKFHPEAKFLVSLIEKNNPQLKKIFADFDHIILAKNLGFTNFNNFIFKYSIVEASTAIKGQLFKYMMKQFPNEKQFIYLDPDIILYSKLNEVEKILETESIILTPHMLKPGNIDMEISSLKHGTYNLGFLALRKSKESLRFINWWTNRLYHYCYDDIPQGLFTDQKWINLAPSLFNTYILKKPGYNFATWSLKTRTLTKENKIYYVDGHPLRFIHYSGYDSNTIDWAINQWIEDSNNPFLELYDDYKRQINKYLKYGFEKISWTYDFYSSGEQIAPEVRKKYRYDNLEEKIDDPYLLSNEQIYRL